MNQPTEHVTLFDYKESSTYWCSGTTWMELQKVDGCLDGSWRWLAIKIDVSNDQLSSSLLTLNFRSNIVQVGLPLSKMSLKTVNLVLHKR